MTDRRRAFRLDRRGAGVLLHPTSLPGPHGCGDLGPAAYKLVDFLAAAGQSWWQMLPINPVGPANSPYDAHSAFAGNPLLVSLERLAADGLLSQEELAPVRGLRADRACYPQVTRYRVARLRRACERFVQRGDHHTNAFFRFRAANAAWLERHALYSAIRQRYGAPWTKWPAALRLGRRTALRRAGTELTDDITFERFVQFQFARQWSDLRDYAHRRGIGLIGDIPIFVAHDSSDVWALRDLFDLDRSGQARTVSGVPPDYFSRDGQRWGHPHYRWRQHATTDFAWWVARVRHTLAHFDAVRIDHFLGFNRVWKVPGRAKTARHGRWARTPGRALFTTLRREIGRLEIIAEDLGLLVPEAVALRDDFGFPGMRLLHFAFGGDDAGSRYHQPHNHVRNCVVYPGTHDNETTVGWLQRLKSQRRPRTGVSELERVRRYAGAHGRDLHWDVIRLAYASPANLCVIPLQDVLGLDNRARMNTPATISGNWAWRFQSRQLTDALAARLHALSVTYDRCPTPSGRTRRG